MPDSLKKYRQMRDFGDTPEPSGGKPKRTRLPIFVIQKHHASQLHYDFRLEMEGVLKSWAVPKGPSYDPTVKRLAMMTEDHPYDYAGFEGAIPEGNYGAGSVIIWDAGTWQFIEPGDDPVKALKQGKLGFRLFGHGYRFLGIGCPDLVAMRSTVPSLSIRRRTLVGAPDLGSTSITLE